MGAASWSAVECNVGDNLRKVLLKNKLQVSSQAEIVHLAIDTGVIRVGAQAG